MKKVLLISSILTFIILFSACSSNKIPPTVTSVDDVFDKQIGVMAGSVATVYGGFYGNTREYQVDEAMVADLKAGVLDCALTDSRYLSSMLKHSRSIKALDDPLISVDFSIVTAKESQDLMADINNALEQLQDDGTLKMIESKHFFGEEYDIFSTASSDAGSLRLVVSPTLPPYCHRDEGGVIIGFDIDVALAVCNTLGVNLEIVETDSSEIIKTVWSARGDFGMGGLYVTPENEDMAVFSNPYTNCTLNVLTLK